MQCLPDGEEACQLSFTASQKTRYSFKTKQTKQKNLKGRLGGGGGGGDTTPPHRNQSSGQNAKLTYQLIRERLLGTFYFVYYVAA